MEIKYYYDLIQGSEEWLHARLGIITASQMGKLITPMGKIASNDDSRAIVYEKVSERINKRVEDGFSTSHTERGNTFEPFARDLYSEKKAQVRECGFITRQFDGFKIGYSPDGLVGDDGSIEIICPTPHKHVKGICENKSPTEKMMQMQTGMLVTGRKWCDYISHVNGMHQRIVRVEPDLELHSKIMLAAKNLEECIQHNMNIYNEYTQHMPMANLEESI